MAGRMNFVDHSLDAQYPCFIQVFNIELRNLKKDGQKPPKPRKTAEKRQETPDKRLGRKFLLTAFLNKNERGISY